jgi:hypothetical protein
MCGGTGWAAAAGRVEAANAGVDEALHKGHEREFNLPIPGWEIYAVYPHATSFFGLHHESVLFVLTASVILTTESSSSSKFCRGHPYLQASQLMNEYQAD